MDLTTGLAAVEEIRCLVPPGQSMAVFALRYCLSDPGVSTVIPGAKNPDQARQNATAGELGPLDEATLGALARSTKSASPPRSTTAGDSPLIGEPFDQDGSLIDVMVPKQRGLFA